MPFSLRWLRIHGKHHRTATCHMPHASCRWQTDACRWLTDACRWLTDACRWLTDTCRWLTDTCRWLTDIIVSLSWWRHAQGNGLWTLAALAPVPRYAPEYSRTIARWIYSLANYARYFYGDHIVDGRESNPGDKWDTENVVGYEGLRKCDFNRTVGKCVHGEEFGPFATGDWCEALNCTDIRWAFKYANETVCFM